MNELEELRLIQRVSCGDELSLEKLGEDSTPGCGGTRLKYVRSSMCGFWFVCEDCGKITYVNRP